MSNIEIEFARKQFGAPGTRSFSFWDRLFYLNVRKPNWCTENDDLFPVFQRKWDILQNGVVVWAHIIQANSLLFESGHMNCPASVIFNPDPSAEMDLGQMMDSAHSLFELKHTKPDDPELREFADNLTDEMVRTFGVKVPASVSRGQTMFEATTFVTRKHLPNGVLSLPFFPLVVQPSAPYYNLPLPSRYWPDMLIDDWTVRDR